MSVVVSFSLLCLQLFYLLYTLLGKHKRHMGLLDPMHASLEVQLVFNIMHEGFDDICKDWKDPIPTMGVTTL